MPSKSIPGVVTALILAIGAAAAQSGRPPIDPPGLQRLAADSRGTAQVSHHRATGAARFVRIPPGALGLQGTSSRDRAADFFERYGSVFGIEDPSVELEERGARTDRLGAHRRRYEQRYRGLPVFGGVVQAHFDGAGRLVVVNGTFVPGISVDPKPRRTAAQAASVAVAHVSNQRDDPDLGSQEQDLLIFRSGLVQGIPGRDHLAYRVEVGNGWDVREFVFVDAHTGKVVDQITGIHTTIERRIHEPDFNNVVIWADADGDPLPYSTGNPTNDDQVNGLIDYSQDVYDLFLNLSGGTFFSWNRVDGIMDSIWKASFLSCPNASWNGRSTNFCNGVAADDTVGHEWTHAYTDSTHNLIYQWQSGALNEAYSDIFGEVVDFINDASIDPLRAPGGCSTFGGSPPPLLELHAPAAIAGLYSVGDAAFNPSPPFSATGFVELVQDGVSPATDGCETLTGFTSGSIALIDRGNCDFTEKVSRAQNNGAVAVIVVNDQGDGAITMGGSGTGISIPSVMVGQAQGDLIKSQLAITMVSATVSHGISSDASLRWLSGEDDFGFGGAIRDLWNPTCYGDPGRVSDVAQYSCSVTDSGGVHTNSGVPNHAFALLVDGGTYNGFTIGALGLTKAAHIYWRAMEVYQVPVSDFADHADALAQSCSDLIGVNLADLMTGQPSGGIIGPADCNKVAEAMLAVEMSDEPSCGFAPLLDPNGPADCGPVAFFEDFETDPAGVWSLSNSGEFAEYTPRDWEWTSDVPEGGTGSAFFAINDIALGDCVEGSDDQSGVMRVDSPTLGIAGTVSPILQFDHWVATEFEFDGGNLRIFVNDGPSQLIDPSDFTFNPYNDVLQTSPLNTNPMEGQPAFTGANIGEHQGSWGRSEIDLSPYAGPGDTIRLRWKLGVDGCNGRVGWYVDNVRVCGDAVANLQPSIAGLGDLFLDAGGAIDLPLFGSDLDGDNLSFADAGLPPWVSLLDFGDGTGRLLVRPSSSDVGTFASAVAIVDDGTPPITDTTSFNIHTFACSSPAPVDGTTLDYLDPEFFWNPIADATSYHVMGGDMETLRSSGGDFSTSSCVADFLDAFWIAAMPSLAPGEIQWFLVAGRSCAGKGTFDSGSPAQAASRDAGIAAAVTMCPVIGCGNGYAEIPEICDGADVAGDVCENYGFGGGTLVCNQSCDGLDFSGCLP
jgi:Zn-dependent metalloprotease